MTETTDTRHEARLETLLMMLMGIVILLMVAIIGLFVRMNQVHQEVLAAAAPLKSLAQNQVELMKQSSQTAHGTGLEIGIDAPPFVLTDTLGSQISLTDFAGKPLVLVFSSPQCSSCVEMWPELDKFSHSRKDVQVAMILLGTQEEAQRVAQTNSFNFPVLYVSEMQQEVAHNYQINSVPFAYMIDEVGVIINAGYVHTENEMMTLVVDGRKGK